MIQIVMKPTPGAGVVDRETLYTALFNGEDVGLRVRGLRASHAEEKMMVIFREQLKVKTVSYNLEQYLKEKTNGNEGPSPEDAEGHCRDA
jgi:hypothetical protein